MKIGVISDTHITNNGKEIPQEILEAFKNVDIVIHCGDLVDIDILKQLKKYCPDTRAVFGNMDSDESRKKLPEKLIFQEGKFKIGVMHGYGHPANLIEVLKKEFRAEKPDLIIFGHSHNPICEKIDGTIFFNPGSPTDKIFAPYNSYGIIEIGDKIDGKIIKLKD